MGYAALLAAGTHQHFPRYWRWRQSMDLAPFHNTAVPTPCRAQPVSHPRVQIRCHIVPHHAMQRLNFPFIVISLLLCFSNANRLNRRFTFVLYFRSSRNSSYCPLHWTARLPDWYPLPLQLSHGNTQRSQRLKLLSPHCPQQGLVKDKTMNNAWRSGRPMSSKLPRQKF